MWWYLGPRHGVGIDLEALTQPGDRPTNLRHLYTQERRRQFGRLRLSGEGVRSRKRKARWRGVGQRGDVRLTFLSVKLCTFWISFSRKSKNRSCVMVLS